MITYQEAKLLAEIMDGSDEYQDDEIMQDMLCASKLVTLEMVGEPTSCMVAILPTELGDLYVGNYRLREQIAEALAALPVSPERAVQILEKALGDH